MPEALLPDHRNTLYRFWTVFAAKPVQVFLVFWTVLNLLQVGLLDLTSDEGYYWFYAQHLQWGYYDHPPMIAVLIKAGTAILPGELGVRFFNVVLSTAGLALFFSLLKEEQKQSLKTYWVLLSAPLLHYLTFLLFPDGPLLFFSLLFLVVYKKFLQKGSFATAILLGLSLALMAYSKYHGALVLIFTVLANPRLLKNGYFYVSLLTALVLFAPHLWWQYKEGFPTLQYHLSGRTGQWGLRYVGEYLSQQLVAIGPGLIFIPFISKTKDLFERTLKVIIIGTFVFFLVSSFKTFVHFHWTSIALYPLLYFAVAYYGQAHTKKRFRWLILPFVALFFIARLLLMIPLIPNMHVGEDYYHGRETWAKEVSALAGDRPVFMPNNLREASLYAYYSGKPGVTLYNRPEKKSQYELWGYEDSLQGKEVVLLTKYPFYESRELATNLRTLHYSAIPSFRSFYTGVSIEPISVQQTGDSIVARLVISNQRNYPLPFEKGPEGETTALVYSVEKTRKIIQADVAKQLSVVDRIEANGRIERTIVIPKKDLPADTYTLFFGLRYGVLPDAILSKGMSILIR
ncbi:glycosyltransferase family 39 protein [Flavisolibacter sp. BT320]|nr:glycosyltransferase family 39 protein [Flavisolibacter longurius]